MSNEIFCSTCLDIITRKKKIYAISYNPKPLLPKFPQCQYAIKLLYIVGHIISYLRHRENFKSHTVAMLMDPLSIEVIRTNLKIMIQIFYHDKYFFSFYKKNNFTFLHNKFIKKTAALNLVYISTVLKITVYLINLFKNR